LIIKNPSHLKRVATLPCETLMFKIDLISTLITPVTVWSLRVMSSYNRIIDIFRHLKWFYYIRCDITLSFLIYSAGCYLFRELCQPWHSVHHLLPPVRKCSSVRDPHDLPDFWLPNSPEPQHISLQNLGQRVYQKIARMWTIFRRHLIDVWVWVEQSVIGDGIDQWRRRLHACIGTTGGHFEYSPWQKLAKTLLTVIN